MSLISGNIPNLINGISQQPYPVRLASQGEILINGLPSPVDGLSKRPPTQHIARIMGAHSPDALVHTIDRDPTERYAVVITSGDLKVFRLDGTEVSVSFPHGKAYLASSTPSTTHKILTVADFSFVLNKTVTAGKTTTTAPTRPFEALVWIRQGAYNASYSITLNGVTTTVSTPDGTLPAHANQIKTEQIAATLTTQLAALFPTAGFFFGSAGSSILISRPSVDFTVTTQDSSGDTLMRAVKGSVQRFTDLPARAFGGFRAQIRGDNSNAYTGHFVEYEEGSGTISNGGIWKESLKGGEEIQLDQATLPHVLVREVDGTFTFRRQDWATRKVGDLISNPFPSFVGRKINDVFFYRNRLGFLADENVIMSRADSFFDFFRETAIQVLDTDMIDTPVSHTKVSVLHHAVAFNEQLLLLSDTTQFVLRGTDALTPRTVRIDKTTDFNCSTTTRPVAMGRNVYFAHDRGNNTVVQEYYVDDDTGANDADDVTAHVANYIPSGAVKLAGAPGLNLLLVVSKEDRSKLFFYRLYAVGQDKLQSAWGEWQLGTVLNVDFVGSDAILAISRADGLYLERMSLASGLVDPGLPVTLLLDRKVTKARLAGLTYNAGTNQSTFTLPYPPQAGEELMIVAGTGHAGYRPGQIIPHTRSGTAVTVSMEMTGDMFLGIRYTLRYRFSPFLVRQPAPQGGQVAITNGRLQIKRLTVQISRTGYFRLEFTPFGRATYTIPFTGRVVGSVASTIGNIALETGTVGFGVNGQNTGIQIDLVNDSFLPSTFLGCDWEGELVLRSRRM
ncbi:hypothetical protein UFOVP347_33 [uncultured Caudovirales phage]|uniref:Tail tubular protein B n=1 Tax=uncultured Caudovirales phage TaxID=2100421 RepID=A0A6J5M1X4_9CAUD|nr:hypothetical protein UFOVP347_33 [uncultured Caudovirales phage]